MRPACVGLYNKARGGGAKRTALRRLLRLRTEEVEEVAAAASTLHTVGAHGQSRSLGRHRCVSWHRVGLRLTVQAVQSSRGRARSALVVQHTSPHMNQEAKGQRREGTGAQGEQQGRVECERHRRPRPDNGRMRARGLRTKSVRRQWCGRDGEYERRSRRTGPCAALDPEPDLPGSKPRTTDDTAAQ